MARLPIIGTCALCRKEKELKRSHIASKFLWRHSGITGHKKSFSVKSPTHPELNETNLQDGFKEHLLCEDCERQFANYEDYVVRSLFHRKGPIQNRPDSHYLCTGLNYAKVKLFQMSILWRMGVSKHPFYAMVDLGKHEEILRCMLKEEDPGEHWRYGCIATILNHGGEPLLGISPNHFKPKSLDADASATPLRGCIGYTLPQVIRLKRLKSTACYYRQMTHGLSFEAKQRTSLYYKNKSSCIAKCT